MSRDSKPPESAPGSKRTGSSGPAESPSGQEPRATSKTTCPRCKASAIRPGATKCPACQAWIAGPPRLPLRGWQVVAVASLLVAAAAATGMFASAGAPALSWITARAPVDSPAATLTPSSPGSAASATPGSSSVLAAASASPSVGAADAGGAEAGASGAPPAIDPTPVAWSDPQIIRLGAAPVAAVISDDDATVFILGEDATLRAHPVRGGAEVRKLVVPGKGTGLRLLGGRYLAVLGVPGSMLPIVDTSAWTLVQLDIGGPAVDVALIGRDRQPEPGATKGEGSHMVAVSGLGRRVARFALGTWKPEGQVMLSRTITGVMVTRAAGREALAVLTQATRAGELGAIDVFDPAAAPFGGTRLSWAAAVDPRGSSAQLGGDEILIVDRGASQLLRLPHDEPLRIANVGQQPLGAFRLLDRYAVTVDAVGTATVVSLPNLEVRATLALGAVPSDAVATSDGRALLIALGGGPRQQGALTAIVTGDPPVVAAKIRTGVGAHSVSVSKSDRAAVVTSYWTKTVAVLSRR